MKIMLSFQSGKKNRVQGLMEKSRQQDPCYQQAPATQNWYRLKRHYTTTENRRKVMERAPRGVLPAWWHRHQIPKRTHNKAVGYFGRRSREEPTKCHIYLHFICHRQFAFHFQFGVILQDIGIWWFTFIRTVHELLLLNFGKWPIYWKKTNTEWSCVTWVSSHLFQCIKLRFLFYFIAQSFKEPNIDSFVLETNGNLESQ